MIDSIEVRYDGADTDHHHIGAAELAESLQGFARVFGTVYHFAATGDFVSKAPAQSVRMFVSAAEPACFKLLFEAWEFAKQQQAFQGVVGTVAGAVLTYVFGRIADRKGEMKHLAAALQAAIAQTGRTDATTVDRLLATVDKMADALRPAVRQAVAPIGASCATVRIGGAGGTVLDAQDKQRIMAAPDATVTPERRWPATITELDRENATGKARLDGDLDGRVPLSITDPAFGLEGNAYMRAFISGAPVVLVGKAEIVDGDIRRLFVSDTA